METLKKYKILLKGITPLIMHSDTLCNPLHPLKKKMMEISSIKAKKDEHYYAMAKIEYDCAMYYDKDLGIYMPSKCLKACLKCAAKKFRLGKFTKAINIDAAIGVPLKGMEKENPQTLWDKTDKDGKQIHVLIETIPLNKVRVMCTRPIFNYWELEFDLFLNVDILSFNQLKNIFDVAGFEYGLGAKRPEKANGINGRFIIESMKEL